MSVIAIIRRWPIASGLFGLHIVIVLLVYFAWLTSTDPWGERNMIWLLMYAVDFPTSYVYIIVDHADAWLFAVTCIVVGGVQWIFVGVLFDLWRSRRR